MNTMWRGWKTSGVSLGRTSRPQVSVAMAAMSCSATHSTLPSPSPGRCRRRSRPNSPRRRAEVIAPVRTKTKSPAPTVTPAWLCCTLQLLGVDRVARLEPVDAERPRHVEQDAATDHPVGAVGYIDS